MTEILKTDETGSDRTHLLETIDMAFTKPSRKGYHCGERTADNVSEESKRYSDVNLEVFAMPYQDPTIRADDLFLLHVVGVLLHILLEADLASLEWM